MSRTVPYVVGQWVRGPQFYGRGRELETLLARERGAVWVCGLRRIGKTSLLRQLELLAGERGRLPLFWDLQGVDDAAELAFGLEDALLDAEEALAAHGIDAADFEGRDLAGSLRGLLAALEERHLPLLLLCDEADELVSLAATHPGIVSALGDAIRDSSATVVLTCSPRSVARAVDHDAGLVAALDAPLPLGALSDEEARARDVIEKGYRDGGLKPPDGQTLATLAGVKPDVVDRVTTLLVRQKVLARVDDLVFHEAALQQLKKDVRALRQGPQAGTIDVSTFKDRFGVTRKFAIPLLEYLDRERVTRRVGESRQIL